MKKAYLADLATVHKIWYLKGHMHGIFQVAAGLLSITGSFVWA